VQDGLPQATGAVLSSAPHVTIPSDISRAAADPGGPEAAPSVHPGLSETDGAAADSALT
jgi:hypothetical protein